MSVSQVKSQQENENPTLVVDSSIPSEDTEFGNELDELTLEPIAPQKTEQARRVVAAYSSNAAECKHLLLMLGLMLEKSCE